MAFPPKEWMSDKHLQEMMAVATMALPVLRAIVGAWGDKR